MVFHSDRLVVRTTKPVRFTLHENDPQPHQLAAREQRRHWEVWHQLEDKRLARAVNRQVDQQLDERRS